MPHKRKSPLKMFLLQDEGSFQMKQPARDLLQLLGSERAKSLNWRDMWAMVTVKHGMFLLVSVVKRTITFTC